MDDRNDRYLPLARRIASQTPEERAKALRGMDPAVLKACVEVMRLRLLDECDVDPAPEASK
jgi:hypothetical protein